MAAISEPATESRSIPPSHAPDRAARRELLKVWVPVAVLALLAFTLAWQYLEPPLPEVLTIAAGSADGAYFGFAESYRPLLAEHDVELRVLETAGSVENLRLLSRGDADLALLQGGIEPPEDAPRLEAVASLFFEPVWLFHRSETSIELITDLVGLRVGIGGADSGTRRLVEELLADNGLDLERSLEASPLGGGAAADALRAGSLDAAFFVASPRAEYVRTLLASDDVGLMPFRRHRAYRVGHPYLSRVVLGEGVVDLQRNLPAEDIELVAAAAALVARSELHHALVPLLVEVADDVHGGAGLFEEPGTFPSPQWLDLPLKAEAEHYLEKGPSFLFRWLPYRTAVSVDRLKILLLPFIPLLLLVFKAAPPLYRWRIRSKIFRWYRDLRALDLFIRSNPDAESAVPKLEAVRRLEDEVMEIDVPLGYMDTFYDLRVHIDLIETKLEEIVHGDAQLE